MPITLRQVETFRAVLDTGSMTRAAELLGVSQPTVSRLIADMEAEIGLVLFERSGRVVQPTPEALAIGQKIPIRVVRAQHAPMQPQASIVGALLVCDQMAPAYRLRGALDRSARAELAPMLAAVELELEARAALVKAHRADLWFFEALLYAYRAAEAAAEDGAEAAAWEGGPVWEGPRHLLAVEEGAETVSALDIVRRAVAGENVPVSGVWSRSLALYRSSPLVAVARAAPPPAWAVVDGTPRAAFAEFLKNILDFLVATRELIEVYCAHAPLDRRLVLWGVMRAAQRPVV
jgi:DNA-binding transcriptional LysR family regulator